MFFNWSITSKKYMNVKKICLNPDSVTYISSAYALKFSMS